MVNKNFDRSRRRSAPRISPYSSAHSNTFASRPSFAGEWASELLTSITESSSAIRQFIGGSLLSPVSTAWMWRA